jgi:hypothetical protein
MGSSPIYREIYDSQLGNGFRVEAAVAGGVQESVPPRGAFGPDGVRK